MDGLLSWWVGGELGATGRLEWWGQDLLPLAVVVALAVWALALVGRRRLSGRLVEAVALAAALAGVVVALGRPAWVEEEGREQSGRIAVLVDASRSMAVREGGRPRHEAVEHVLAQLPSDVDFYNFGGDLAVGLPATFDAPTTDLEGALQALGERVAGERLQAVVVLTDGLDRGLLRRRVQADPDALPPDLPGPLTVYQIGSPGDARDVAVRGVDTGGFAFLRSSFSLTAHLESSGYAGRTIQVQLTRDGAPVTTRKATLGDDGRADVTFQVTPLAAGRFAYTVEVPVFEDDAIPANNRLPVVVRVVRDRIRVLQVAGLPTWDVKFLRRFLKGDPSVDLVSFFILRTDEDMDAGYRDQELALIPFPYQDLFREDLSTFDVVVFHNFDYKPYLDPRSFGRGDQLLENLRDYVRDQGGALVMIGGDRSFDLGEYGSTPLADVLPVELGVPRDDAVVPESFVPVLTAEGARHPITRLVGDPDESAQWWERLHPLDGANRVVGPARGATVLLEHPTATDASGRPLPVLAVREVGRGRTLALTTDGSWRWSFSEAAQGRGNQAYLRFWKNAIRWLVDDPMTSRVTVETARENYAVEDEVRVVARVKSTSFAPVGDASVRVEVLRDGVVVDELEGTTSSEGEAIVALEVPEQGAYRVRVDARTARGGRIGVAQTVFAVTERDPELDEVAPDAAFLQWLADATGGRYYGPGEDGPVQRDPTAGRTVWERRETELSRAPVLGLWVLGWLGVAWVARRRQGMR